MSSIIVDMAYRDAVITNYLVCSQTEGEVQQALLTRASCKQAEPIVGQRKAWSVDDEETLIKLVSESSPLLMKGNIDLLPITKEKYTSFTKNFDDYYIKFRFIYLESLTPRDHISLLKKKGNVIWLHRLQRSLRRNLFTTYSKINWMVRNVWGRSIWVLNLSGMNPNVRIPVNI